MNPVEFLIELSERLMTENLTLLAEGGMLLNGDGIVITDDVENEYISQSDPPLVIETEYAVQLSWLFSGSRKDCPIWSSDWGRRPFMRNWGWPHWDVLPGVRT